MSRDAGITAAMQFQRKDGPVHVKKPVRKYPLRYVHILGILIGLAAFFFGLTRLQAFLFGWDRLDVRTAEISCPDSRILECVRPIVETTARGNILRLDASRVKAGLEAHPWVKEARVRKVFPSSLAVDIQPRLPAAILDVGGGYLLGRDGVLIEPALPGDADRLPLIRDEGMFAADRELKLNRAWACFEDCDAGTKARILALDVTDPENVVLTFRNDPVQLRLGTESYGLKIATYLAGRDGWSRDFGPLEYVDLRFSDRIYLKAGMEEAQ